MNNKKLVYALRHNPQKFGLNPDEEGWVDLQTFLNVMKITKDQLNNIIQNMDKKRLEIKDDKIRAAYGHSYSSRVKREETKPPDVLYHGTPSFTAFLIKKEGLKPMSRQYVHLSTSPKTAIIVGQRRQENPTILRIDAKKAFEDGVKFYYSNEDIWLADYIPSKYIS
jgi:putative RNA 2'-phosphotransferase